jgi:hypothetical protein
MTVPHAGHVSLVGTVDSNAIEIDCIIAYPVGNADKESEPIPLWGMGALSLGGPMARRDEDGF